MDELVIGEKRYVSSKKAAEITGYAKDYVGQLCREGYVEAKMVGRSWYVLETSIQEHRFGGLSENRNTDRGASESKKGSSIQESTEDGGKDDENTVETNTDSNIESESPVLGWQRPIYVAEEQTAMPEMEVRSEPPTAAQGHSGAFSNELSQPIPDAETAATEGAISDMQAAWKEWFEQKTTSTENDSEVSQEIPEYVAKHSDVGTNDESDETDSEVSKTVSNDDDGDDEEGFAIPIQRQKVAPVEDDAEVDYDDVESAAEGVPPVKAVQIPLRRMRPHEEGIIHEERIIVSPHKESRAQRRNKGSRSNKTRSSLLLRTVLIAIAGLMIATAVVGSGLANTSANPIVDYLGGTSKVHK